MRTSRALSALFLALLAVVVLSASAPVAPAELGKSVYGVYCGSCHGEKGDGQGAAAAALTPRPTDFTAAAYWAGKTDDQVATGIREGKPGTTMIGYEAMLSDEQVDGLVAHLKTFQP